MLVKEQVPEFVNRREDAALDRNVGRVEDDDAGRLRRLRNREAEDRRRGPLDLIPLIREVEELCPAIRSPVALDEIRWRSSRKRDEKRRTFAL